MRISKRKASQTAIISGMFLSEAILNILNKSDEELKTSLNLVNDSLNTFGVEVSNEEIKSLKEISKELALTKVMALKSKISNTIEALSDKESAGWFDLSFSIMVHGLYPNIIDYQKGDIIKVAIELGFSKIKFQKLLKELKGKDFNQAFLDFYESSLDIISAPSIFISYSSRDKELVKELMDLFHKHKVKTFIADVDLLPGMNWVEELRIKLEDSEEVLIIITPNTVDSKWVMIELGAAWVLGKKITPAILYQDVASLPEPLKEFQAIEILTTSAREKLVNTISNRLYK